MQERLSTYTLVTRLQLKRIAKSLPSDLEVSPKACKACYSIEKYSECIMIMTLAGKPKTTIICCYSPKNTPDNVEEVTRFYNDLATVASVPAHNCLIISGDFNAKLGPGPRNFSSRSTKTPLKMVDVSFTSSIRFIFSLETLSFRVVQENFGLTDIQTATLPS